MKITSPAGGVVLHERPGEGQMGLPWVLVHGWCCDHRAMLPVAAAFPERRHILVDLPGHGASPDSGDVSIATHAKAVLEAVPDERFIVVGHSMGALVALAMAGQAPERIAGVVLVEPAHILPTEKARETAEIMQRSLARFEPAEIVRTFARTQLRGPLDAPMAAAFDRLVETMAATPADIARRVWDAVLKFDGPAALARLATPTLAITIDTSVNRPAELARANRLITTGQVAAAGHMVQFEAMEQVAAMIRRWLLVAGIEAIDSRE